MASVLVNAHLNSKDGEMGQAILLGPNYLFGREISNSYIFRVGNILCTGIMNWFVNEYFVDDKYGIITSTDENYYIYSKYLKGAK